MEFLSWLNEILGINRDCRREIVEEIIPPKIVVRETREMGRGVYAVKDFRSGELIERVPIIRDKSTNFIGEMMNYIFDGGNGSSVIGLGYCSLYNHANTPSAEYVTVNDTTMEIRACHDILSGDEIKISYGDDYWNSRGIKPL